MITGSALGYAIVLIVSPLITRFYSPEEFGRFSIYGALIAIFSILATLSFEFAILGSSRRTEALRFSFLSTVVSFFVLIFSAVFLVILNLADIAGPLNSSAQTLLAFVGCFLAVLTNISTNWAIRSNKSSIAASGAFLSLSMRSIFQATLGYCFGGLYGLIFGDILGRLIGYWAVEQRVVWCSIKRFIKKKNLIFMQFKKNTEYVYHLTPANAIETSLVWLSAPLFSLYYDPFIGGVIAMVQRIAFAPVSLINQTLGQIFHYYASKIYHHNPSILVKNVVLIALFTLPILFSISFFLGFYGRDLSIIIFGNDWGDAGDVLCILLPLYYMYFLSLFTSKLIIIMSRNYIKLISSIAQLFFLLASLPLARMLELDWTNAIKLQSSGLAFLQLIVFVYVLFLAYFFPKFGSIRADYFFSKRV